MFENMINKLRTNIYISNGERILEYSKYSIEYLFKYVVNHSILKD